MPASNIKGGHDEWWQSPSPPPGKNGEYLSMAGSTKAYEEHAKSVIGHISHIYERRYDSYTRPKRLWIHEEEDSPVRVWTKDLEGDVQDSSSSCLRDMLMNCTQPPSEGKLSRRIIILERMTRRLLDSTVFAFNTKDSGVDPSVELQDHITFELSASGQRASWKLLENRLATLEAACTDHMDEFAQRAVMEEKSAAIRQARSAGQLTKIATIIVPCTFVASIFSMGGSFAAGEKNLYVYWVISVPITIVLLLWVLHEDIDGGIRGGVKDGIRAVKERIYRSMR
ncbi:hypothetical protein E8E13_002398 [Curvularia kusanoi]|uniref:Uncharacterized protein n=1 Tax=Curvularia kusanoi TaxID=90978 RepID=A0A9P4WBT0_CURKU|nr:hypothetical protein E8E13_002398 [Curvularia kusanoi]